MILDGSGSRDSAKRRGTGGHPGAALEDLIAEVEALSESSPLPEKVDRAYWDRWLEGIVTSEVLGEVGRRWADYEESWKAIR